MASWPPFKVGKYLGFDDGPRLPTGETEGGSRLNDLKDVELPPYSEQDDIWDVARKTLPNTLEERPTVVAVMGPTGTGKSTFISKLAGREMNIGHNLSSCECTLSVEKAKTPSAYCQVRYRKGRRSTLQSR